MSKDNRVELRGKPRLSVDEYEEKMLRRRMNYDGAEVCSSVPIAPPIGYERKPSMVEYIRDMVRTELSRSAGNSGMETFEEADDFDVDDDPFPASTFEMEETFEPEVPHPQSPAPEPQDGSEGEEGHSPKAKKPAKASADPKPKKAPEAPPEAQE